MAAILQGYPSKVKTGGGIRGADFRPELAEETTEIDSRIENGSYARFHGTIKAFPQGVS